MHGTGPVHELHVALDEGDMAKALALADAMPDVNEKAEHGRTALHFALTYRLADAVARTLVVRGARLDVCSDGEGTPLHVAARRADPDTVTFLLEKGADPRARDNGGATPLHHASEGSVPLLVRAGADPDARDNAGATPLHRAAEYGDVDVVRALLDAGADPSLRDNEGRTPLDYARADGDAECIALLEEKA